MGDGRDVQHHPAKAIARFWSKTISGPGDDDCIVFTGALGDDGYGRFWLGSGRVIRAHRFAYVVTFGDIPEGDLLMHSCDITVCVNPAHLALGSALSNRAERTARRERFAGLPAAGGLHSQSTRADIARKIRESVLVHGYDRERIRLIVAGMHPETEPLF